MSGGETTESRHDKGTDRPCPIKSLKSCVRTTILDLTIRGSIRYTTGYPTAVDLTASGKIDVKRLITNRYTFEQAEEAFELVRQGKESVIKVIIGGVAS